MPRASQGHGCISRRSQFSRERHLDLALCVLTFHGYHKLPLRASPVAQWIRIRLPVQSAQVRSPVQENATCLGATKPEHRNYLARVPQLLRPTCLDCVLRTTRSRRSEKPVHHGEEQSPFAATRESPHSPQLKSPRAATKTQCRK